MTREIKFRAWDEGKYRWCEKELLLDWEGDWMSKYGEHSKFITFQFFTGLKDKNGKEIYEGDILLYPDTESEYVDVGVGVSGMKVAEQPVNSFWPVEFRDGEFGLFVKGGEVVYGSSDTNPEWISLRRFDEDYSPKTEWEVIGNIYENPELLKS